MGKRREIAKKVCAVARRAIESYFEKAEVGTLAKELLPPFLKERGGAFVCLKRNGQLRGCIGTVFPCRESLIEEIIQNAVSAATEDRRFQPLSKSELSAVAITVDILSKSETVTDLSTLNPKKFGVIVGWQRLRGVLLPDLEGVDTAEEQLSIARRKAGIPSGVPVTIRRFTVDRYQEDDEGEGGIE
ncbi:MAG TPA: AmmeMemoRadiSam system protein A [Atribacteraceae bacterium]|nr:AmmeMemoRadiSam system protein A [Atribacteraceae bacterium]